MNGKGSPNRWLPWIAIATVVVAIVAGLVLAGSPADARKYRLDERRLQDLQQISSAVDAYRIRHSRIPPTLDSLAADLAVDPKARTDPETAQAYGYRQIDATRYELCAIFALPSDPELDRRTYGPNELSWTHPAGRHCFPRESKLPPR